MTTKRKISKPITGNIVAAKDKVLLDMGQWAPINLATILTMGINDLNGNEMRVYMVLSAFSSIEKGAYPSYSNIAEIAGCNRTTVYRAIERLIEIGLLHKTKRNAENGSQITNKFEVFALAENYKDTIIRLDPVNKDDKVVSKNVAILTSPQLQDCNTPSCIVGTQLEQPKEYDITRTSTNSNSSKSKYPSSVTEWNQIVADAGRYQKAWGKLLNRSSMLDFMKDEGPPKLDLPKHDSDVVEYCELKLAIFSHDISLYDYSLETDALGVFYSLDQYDQTWVNAVYNFILHINDYVFRNKVSNWKLSNQDIDNCLLLKERFGGGLHGWDSTVDFIRKISENAMNSGINKSLGTSYFCANLHKHINSTCMED